MSDEEFGSDKLPLLPPRKSFAPKWILGLVAGVVVGIAWGLAAGCFLFDFDEFLKPYFFSYLAAVVASMTASGLVAGIVQRWPELSAVPIGAFSATILLFVFCPRYLEPPFGILWVMFMPPLGAIGGALTGLLLRLLTRFSRSR
jgi:hypothetical protein